MSVNTIPVQLYGMPYAHGGLRRSTRWCGRPAGRRPSAAAWEYSNIGVAVEKRLIQACYQSVEGGHDQGKTVNFSLAGRIGPVNFSLASCVRPVNFSLAKQARHVSFFH